MKAIAYDLRSGNVQVDGPVPIKDFAEYIAGVYGQEISDPNVTCGDVSGLVLHPLLGDKADFGIGENAFAPDLIAMGSKTPADTHGVLRYRATDEKFGEFTRKLEEICQP